MMLRLRDERELNKHGLRSTRATQAGWYRLGSWPSASKPEMQGTISVVERKVSREIYLVPARAAQPAESAPPRVHAVSSSR